MDKLLPYYQQELGILRRASQQFAERHPALAQELGLAADCSADPEVERLLQSVALLNATTSQRIATAHEQLTAALLRNVKPHAIRNLPSCAIAHVDYSGARSKNITHTSRIERGSEFRAHGKTGDCCFRNAFDITIMPLTVDACRYSQSIDVPSSLPLPSHAASSIELKLSATTAGTPLGKSCTAPLRVYIDAAPPLRAALFEAIFTRTMAVCIESHGKWKVIGHQPFSLPPFGQENSLLPPPLDLLIEYFAQPDKFAFFDIDLPSLIAESPDDAEQLRIVIALPDKRNAAVARVLLELHASHLKLGCSPLINLYQSSAIPIRLESGQYLYRVVAADRAAKAGELYTIDSVQFTPSSEGDSRELPRYEGTSHAGANLFWQLRSMEEGHFIALLDRDGLPAPGGSGVIAISFTSTDGNSPESLKTGQPGGDLISRFCADHPIRLLTRPSASQPRWPEQSTQWKLLTPPRLCKDDAAEALREVLRLHGGTRHMALVDAIRTLHYMSTTSWQQTDGASRYLHGMAITLVIDEARSPDHSMYVFAHLLSHWFRDIGREGSFTQLTLISAATGDVLVRCQPLAGAKPLI
jgi:type VI secretion system protein ImpG